jgi:hypothetical protein
MEQDPETGLIPELAYALADNGIELPVLDITHPQFLSIIDEDQLDEVSKASIQKMLAMGRMSDTQKEDCLVLCASEGGLFEYGLDQDIIA